MHSQSSEPDVLPLLAKPSAVEHTPTSVSPPPLPTDDKKGKDTTQEMQGVEEGVQGTWSEVISTSGSEPVVRPGSTPIPAAPSPSQPSHPPKFADDVQMEDAGPLLTPTVAVEHSTSSQSSVPSAGGTFADLGREAAPMRPPDGASSGPAHLSLSVDSVNPPAMPIDTTPPLVSETSVGLDADAEDGLAERRLSLVHNGRPGWTIPLSDFAWLVRRLSWSRRECLGALVSLRIREMVDAVPDSKDTAVYDAHMRNGSTLASQYALCIHDETRESVNVGQGTLSPKILATPRAGDYAVVAWRMWTRGEEAPGHIQEMFGDINNLAEDRGNPAIRVISIPTSRQGKETMPGIVELAQLGVFSNSTLLQETKLYQAGWLAWWSEAASPLPSIPNRQELLRMTLALPLERLVYIRLEEGTPPDCVKSPHVDPVSILRTRAKGKKRARSDTEEPGLSGAPATSPTIAPASASIPAEPIVQAGPPGRYRDDEGHVRSGRVRDNSCRRSQSRGAGSSRATSPSFTQEMSPARGRPRSKGPARKKAKTASVPQVKTKMGDLKEVLGKRRCSMNQLPFKETFRLFKRYGLIEADIDSDVIPSDEEGPAATSTAPRPFSRRRKPSTSHSRRARSPSRDTATSGPSWTRGPSTAPSRPPESPASVVVQVPLRPDVVPHQAVYLPPEDRRAWLAVQENAQKVADEARVIAAAARDEIGVLRREAADSARHLAKARAETAAAMQVVKALTAALRRANIPGLELAPNLIPPSPALSPLLLPGSRSGSPQAALFPPPIAAGSSLYSLDRRHSPLHILGMNSSPLERGVPIMADAPLSASALPVVSEPTTSPDVGRGIDIARASAAGPGTTARTADSQASDVEMVDTHPPHDDGDKGGSPLTGPAASCDGVSLPEESPAAATIASPVSMPSRPALLSKREKATRRSRVPYKQGARCRAVARETEAFEVLIDVRKLLDQLTAEIEDSSDVRRVAEQEQYDTARAEFEVARSLHQDADAAMEPVDPLPGAARVSPIEVDPTTLPGVGTRPDEAAGAASGLDSEALHPPARDVEMGEVTGTAQRSPTLEGQAV
ncbi:hypothetical protein OF83DRAFT_1172787 [Amylostereum chailletii]|nr:hypothetical protein OF83DRAFT_1172787 [Amylostereum chailletii]